MSSSGAPLESPRGGDRLGPFVLEARLRVGAAAELWSARREDDDARRVRLELLRDGDRSRFLDAKRRLSSARPAGLAPVVGVRELETRALALVDPSAGPSLAERSSMGGAPGPAAAATLAADWAAALAAVASLGLELGPLDERDLELAPGGRARLGGFELGLRAAAVEPPAAGLAAWLHVQLEAAGRGAHPDLRAAVARARAASGEARAGLLAFEAACRAFADPVSLARWTGSGGAEVAPELDTASDVSAGDDATDPRGIAWSHDPTEPGIALDEARTLDVGGGATSTALGPPTLHDTEALEVLTLDAAAPTSALPQIEARTEIDAGPSSIEDATSVAVLDAFASPPGSAEATPSGATPTDPHARFDALRRPSRSEIDEAIQGVPTVAVAPLVAPAPEPAVPAAEGPETARPEAETPGSEVDTLEPEADSADDDPTHEVPLMATETAVVERETRPPLNPASTAVVARAPRAPASPSPASPSPASPSPASPSPASPSPASPSPASPSPAAAPSQEPAGGPLSAPPRSFAPAPRAGADRWLLPALAAILAALAVALGAALLSRT